MNIALEFSEFSQQLVDSVHAELDLLATLNPIELAGERKPAGIDLQERPCISEPKTNRGEENVYIAIQRNKYRHDHTTYIHSFCREFYLYIHKTNSRISHH